jgi:hypothetical protein
MSDTYGYTKTSSEAVIPTRRAGLTVPASTRSSPGASGRIVLPLLLWKAVQIRFRTGSRGERQIGEGLQR